MAKKNRVTISEDIAAEILFLSDRTCCICNERGKQVQIHHIDENPANNAIENLSVLCFDCHNQTMIKGGFGRKLDSSQIIKYRHEWLARVKNRKSKADEIASIHTVTGSTKSVIANNNIEEDFLDYKTFNDPLILKEYLNKILIIHQAQLTITQIKRDTGITSQMIQSSYDMIDFYEEVLIELSTFYPKGHFINQQPKKYFNELISSAFLWHRLSLEPDGVGSGGSIISVMAGGNVMSDLKEMVIDMVNALYWSYGLSKQLDFIKWREDWLK